LAGLGSLPAVLPAMDAAEAAHSLAMACLQVFTLLLGCSKELPTLVIAKVLAALAGQPATAAAEDRHQVAVLQTL
jgi:hypothetical protein